MEQPCALSLGIESNGAKAERSPNFRSGASACTTPKANQTGRGGERSRSFLTRDRHHRGTSQGTPWGFATSRELCGAGGRLRVTESHPVGQEGKRET